MSKRQAKEQQQERQNRKPQQSLEYQQQQEIHEEGDEPKHQSQGNPQTAELPQEKVNLQNLLDLEESNEEKTKEYQKFLSNRQVLIEGPQLVTENVIKSYKLYKIKSRKADQFLYDTCVARRFSDFEFLQKQLVQNHGGSIIPILPEKNIWANVNMEGNDTIFSRVAGLQKYLNCLLKHPKLSLSEELRNFLFENQLKFSEKKGEYFSKIGTEQKIKELASNAYTIGKGLLSRFVSGSNSKQEFTQLIHKPSVEDVKLMEYQRQVTDLMNVITVLRKVVENSVLEMKNIGLLLPESKQSTFDSNSILNEFQDMCKYIVSCNEALTRRHSLRLEVQNLTKFYEGVEKKTKSNPRSQEIDVIRNKIAKSSEKCQRWTMSLLEELEESISIGKSMIEGFIWDYNDKKGSFYNL